ncbi:MAG: SpoIIE family protein phosphatase [Anaerolineae bacterium]|nr:SpoIIE family protein phosphatase [Anaerolineae bacterium]
MSKSTIVTGIAEIEALSDAVSAIASSSLDEDGLCYYVYECISRLVDTYDFQLGIFDGKEYVMKVRVQNRNLLPVSRYLIEGGIIGWMRDTGKNLLVYDFETELANLPARPSYISSNPPRSGIFVPLRNGEQVIGAIVVQSMQPNRYNEAQLRTLSIIAHQAAAGIQNARALARERRRVQQLELVNEVARQTQALLHLDELLPQLVHAIQRIFGYYAVALCLPTPEGDKIVIQSATNRDIVGIALQRGEGVIGSAFATSRMVVVDDIAQDMRYVATSALPNTRSEVAVPLFIENQIVGVMDLESERLAAFTRDDQRYLELLARQVAIAIEDARLYEAEQLAQRLRQEVELAESIQVSFLPKQLPNKTGWELGAAWRAARHVGGDFYDVFELRRELEHQYGLAIADVAGKGVPAALFMALARTLLRAVAFTNRSPADALMRVNDLILADSQADIFVTMLYAIWNPDTGQVLMGNAGHNPALLVTQNGTVRAIKSPGIALGVLDEAFIGSTSFTMQPNEVLLLYTDGITEAIRADQTDFGVERLQAVLRQSRHLSAQTIADEILKAVNQFVGTEPAFDDQTMLVLKRVS